MEFTNSIGMKFVLIPPGEFLMGSTEEEVAELLEEAASRNLSDWYIDRLPSEPPRHRVRITKPFWLGKAEVTQAEYEQVMGRNPSAFSQGGHRSGRVSGVDTSRFPVERVSWEDAVEFCRRLLEFSSERSTGRIYRLPTEAEWEYACRSGTNTTWYSGDDEARLNDVAWYHGNSDGRTHLVGQKTPNAWALYDMHGNVSEWCKDWWGLEYFATSPLEDPAGESEGSSRVQRGGGWSHAAPVCRASSRGRNVPDYRIDVTGFRLALILPKPDDSLAHPTDSERPQRVPVVARPDESRGAAPPPAIGAFDGRQMDTVSKGDNDTPTTVLQESRIRFVPAMSMQPYPVGTQIDGFPVQTTGDPCGPFHGKPVYFQQETGQDVLYTIESPHAVREVLFRGAAMRAMTIEVLDPSLAVIAKTGPHGGGDAWGEFAVALPGGASGQFFLRLHNKASQWFFVANLELR